MEKYTVDIDKVLDDFEESEALEKVLVSHLPQESIYIEPWEHLIKKETNNMTGSKVNSDLKLVQASHEHCPNQDYKIASSGSSSLKEENNKPMPQQNDKENSKLWDYEIFYKPFQEMPSRKHQSLGETNCLDTSNQSKSSVSNVHLYNSDLSQNDSQEEILCVSVQEKTCGMENVDKTEDLHFENSASLENSGSKSLNNSLNSTENLPKNCKEEYSVDKDKNIESKNDLKFSNNDMKIYSKENFSESLCDQISSTKLVDKCNVVDVGACHSKSESSASLSCNDSGLNHLTDGKILGNKEVKVKCFDIPPTSCLYDRISGHTKIFSTDISEGSDFTFSNLCTKLPQKIILQNTSGESFPVTEVKKEKNCEKDMCDVDVYSVSKSIPVSFYDECNAKDITVEEMDEYLETLSDIEPIQDEDSGVSSQEDINGNAFTAEVTKTKSDDVTTKSDENQNKAMNTNLLLLNYDPSLTICKENKALEEHTLMNSECTEKLNCSDDCTEYTSNSSMENRQNDSTTYVIHSKFDSILNSSVIETSNSDETKNSISTDNSLNITRINNEASVSKNLHNNSEENNINNHDISNKNAETFENGNMKEVISSHVNKNCESQNLNKHLDELNRNTDEDNSKCSNINNENDNPTNQYQSNFLSCSADFKCIDDTLCDENEKHTLNAAIENINEYQNNGTDFLTDSQCEETTMNSISSSFEKNACLSQKLQRPTTLNLPSRLIAKVDEADELSSVAEGNCFDHSENAEIPSLNEASSEEPKISDSGEYVKPVLQIGTVKPFWIPDADAANCMHCNIKFTVIKRRHHCRACGKVLCSRCCNQKARLLYLQNKEDRICQPCAEILSSASQSETATTGDSQSSSSCGSSPNFSPTPQISSSTNLTDKSWRPHPNNPDDYCSTIPPLQQIQLSGTRPPPTVMVPIGVLKRGNKPRREPKQVIFSDGIRPGGDLTSLTETVEAVPAYRRLGRRRVDKIFTGEAGQALRVAANSGGAKKNIAVSKVRQRRIVVSDAEGPLPPILLPLDNSVEKMDLDHLLLRLTDGEQRSVVFAVTKNMHVVSQITKLDCCFGKECWCFTSQGLCTVGQDEVMVILERLPDEKVIPRDIFKLFTKIYDSASKGSTFEELSHIIFPEGIFGSCEQTGFLIVRPTFQCLNKLPVPITPFLVAILIQKWEVPWANVFPLRLMLRLGAECRYYPCSLVSVRNRKPVYFEIGQTIMSVLADLRNYQFTIPTVPGLIVHMEEKKTSVNIPRNRYEKVMKVLSSNYVEHVLALGSNFSTEADSHLVCMQKDDGDYHTQAINIRNTTRRVTGASFIVFSGGLKSSSGLSAKFSIVEDGLLVQIPQETMVTLNISLRDMKDLTIPCGEINSDPEEIIVIQWTKDDKKFNLGVRSPIDGKSLEGVQNLRIHTSTDYAGEHYLIRWTEVFFLEVEKSGNCRQNEMVDPCRLAETIAQSFCMALTPYLDMLADADLKTIGLRVSLDSERDKVEYDVGACGKPLPSLYMNALDSGLIPVILRLSGSSQNEPLALELIFHILFK